jgi:hypothetical protein
LARIVCSVGSQLPVNVSADSATSLPVGSAAYAGTVTKPLNIVNNIKQLSTQTFI